MCVSSIIVSSGCVKGQFDVEFNGNGGTLVSGVEWQTVSSADEIVPPVYEREGWRFVGWDTILSEIDSNTTVKALWKNTITVNFKANGGTLVSGEENQTVYKVADIVVPVYERTGYTLSWDITDFSNITEDITVNAIWTANSYTLSFKVDGITFGQSKTVSYDAKIGELPTPSKADMKFSHWTVDGSKIDENTIWKLLGNKTAVAQFRPYENYKIEYVLNGGTANNPTTYNELTSTITLNNPIKTGYEFLGWTSADITEPSKTVQIKNSTGDKKFTANWKAKEYTLSFSEQGIDDITVTYDKMIGELPVAQNKVDKNFSHWTIGGQTVRETDIWNFTDSKLAVAQWIELDHYSIKYFDCATENASSYTENTETFTLTNPTKEGYEFLGWTGTGIGNIPVREVTIEKGSTGNKEFTAKWKALEFSLGFDVDGRYDVFEEITVTYGQPIGTLPAPTKSGWRFGYWKIDGLAITENTVWNYLLDKFAVAEFIELSYFAIVYDLDGGSLEVANPSLYNEDTETFTLNNPTKAGYDFIGWIGTNISASSPQIVVEIVKGTTGDREYTACWAPKKYELILLLDGGECDQTVYQVEYYKAVGELPTPTKKDYEFLGWYYGDDKITESKIYTYMQSIEITAKWQRVGFTINFQPWSIVRNEKVLVTVEGGTPADKKVGLDYVFGSCIPKFTPYDTNEYRMYGWLLNNKKIDSESKYGYKEEMTIEQFLEILANGSSADKTLRAQILQTGEITLIARSSALWTGFY